MLPAFSVSLCTNWSTHNDPEPGQSFVHGSLGRTCWFVDVLVVVKVVVSHASNWTYIVVSWWHYYGPSVQISALSRRVGWKVSTDVPKCSPRSQTYRCLYISHLLIAVFRPSLAHCLNVFHQTLVKGSKPFSALGPTWTMPYIRVDYAWWLRLVKKVHTHVVYILRHVCVCGLARAVIGGRSDLLFIVKRRVYRRKIGLKIRKKVVSFQSLKNPIFSPSHFK